MIMGDMRTIEFCMEHLLTVSDHLLVESLYLAQ